MAFSTCSMLFLSSGVIEFCLSIEAGCDISLPKWYKSAKNRSCKKRFVIRFTEHEKGNTMAPTVNLLFNIYLIVCSKLDVKCTHWVIYLHSCLVKRLHWNWLILRWIQPNMLSAVSRIALKRLAKSKIHIMNIHIHTHCVLHSPNETKRMQMVLWSFTQRCNYPPRSIKTSRATICTLFAQK